MKTRLLAPITLTALLLAGAAAPKDPTPLDKALKLLDKRPDWDKSAPADFPRHPAEKFLKDVTFVLDPGHGGDAQIANYKRGPSGAREAEMNLRVALLLKRLLADAGANVILTREADDDISLERRAEIANTAKRTDGGAGADLFISLHHNTADKPNVNYTSVWYHGDIDGAEPDLDVARVVSQSITRALRTEAARTSSILSDTLMYKSGFGVLRQTRVPAILCESSFYSNPDEERRLKDAAYNLKEAYAIYTGLCEWASEGRPTQTTPVVHVSGKTAGVGMVLSEGLPEWWGSEQPRILSSTISLSVDGISMPFKFDRESRSLTAFFPENMPLDDRPHLLLIRHANLFKHHNYPQRYAVSFLKNPDGTFAPRVEPLGSPRGRLAPASRPTSRPSTIPTTDPTELLHE